MGCSLPLLPRMGVEADKERPTGMPMVLFILIDALIDFKIILKAGNKTKMKNKQRIRGKDASAGTRTQVATLGGLHPTPGLLTLRGLSFSPCLLLFNTSNSKQQKESLVFVFS